MSAGRFTLEKYECDNGEICPVRVQPETLTFDAGGGANAAPTGALTMNTFATVNKGRREYGIGTRKICIEWTAAPPTGYDDRGCLRIPILAKAIYDAIPLLATGTYQGSAFRVTSKTPEFIR